MSLYPPCEFKFKERTLDGGGRHVALANQFVNTCWCRPQQFDDLFVCRIGVSFLFYFNMLFNMLQQFGRSFR